MARSTFEALKANPPKWHLKLISLRYCWYFAKAAEEQALVKFDTRRSEDLHTGHNPKDRYIESSGTPPGCETNSDLFPVVSADSDHRLLSGNPSGCARVSQLYVKETPGSGLQFWIIK